MFECNQKRPFEELEGLIKGLLMSCQLQKSAESSRVEFGKTK